MVDTVVFGAAGYAGGELCRLLLGHPELESLTPVSRRAGCFADDHPNLYGTSLEYVDEQGGISALTGDSVAFLCTPAGEAAELATRCLATGAAVIDLSADFRFDRAELYEQTYGRTHRAPGLLERAVYGLTEYNRSRIERAALVANPGCYVMAASLALIPLLKAGFWSGSGPIHITAINGTTGASSTPEAAMLHSRMAANVQPYSLGGHRHAPEMELVLQEYAETTPMISLATAHGPFTRGISLTATFDLAGRPDATRAALLACLIDAYGRGTDGEFFIRVLDNALTGGRTDKNYRAYPVVSSVLGSNFCHLGVDVDGRLGVARVTAVLDNLGKGAAGSAVQNMNVVKGIPEQTGLTAYGVL